ncbi:UNKNOWN [Stylonychia lemnae]|uniref:Uncharacterized protein n=1 Tax=Stylonychia lemnae TaxID=5949 RepID=A0A077ZY14_STYLE|nr:UNKNOWN [Stylonychia lemnae]|eukprot:CDW74796.1 UNKNOWN [Stylonychia lemnae]
MTEITTIIRLARKQSSNIKLQQSSLNSSQAPPYFLLKSSFTKLFKFKNIFIPIHKGNTRRQTANRAKAIITDIVSLVLEKSLLRKFMIALNCLFITLDAQLFFTQQMQKLQQIYLNQQKLQHQKHLELYYMQNIPDYQSYQNKVLNQRANLNTIQIHLICPIIENQMSSLAQRMKSRTQAQQNYSEEAQQGSEQYLSFQIDMSYFHLYDYQK